MRAQTAQIKPSPPTHEQWIAAIRAAAARQPSGDAGLTSQEIADALGVSLHRAKSILHEFAKLKRLVVGRAYRPALDTSLRMVPVYRVE